MSWTFRCCVTNAILDLLWPECTIISFTGWQHPTWEYWRGNAEIRTGSFVSMWEQPRIQISHPETKTLSQWVDGQKIHWWEFALSCGDLNSSGLGLLARHNDICRHHLGQWEIIFGTFHSLWTWQSSSSSSINRKPVCYKALTTKEWQQASFKPAVTNVTSSSPDRPSIVRKCNKLFY